MNTRDISLFIYYIAKGYTVTPLDLTQESVSALLIDYIAHINQYATDYYTFYDEVFYPSMPAIRKKLKELQNLLQTETLMFDIVKDETSIRTIMVSISGIPLFPYFGSNNNNSTQGSQTLPNTIDLSRYISALARLKSPPCFRVRQDLTYLLSPDAGLRLTLAQVTNYFSRITQCQQESGVDYDVLEAWNQLPNLTSSQEAAALERKVTRLRFEKFKLTTIISLPSTNPKQLSLMKIWQYNTVDEVKTRLARVNSKIEERQQALSTERLRVRMHNTVVKLLGGITTTILAADNVLLPPELIPSIKQYDYVQSIGDALAVSEPNVETELGYIPSSASEQQEYYTEEEGESEEPSVCTDCLYRDETSLRQALGEVNFNTPDDTLNLLLSNAEKVLNLSPEALPSVNSSKGDKLDFLLTL